MRSASRVRLIVARCSGRRQAQASSTYYDEPAGESIGAPKVVEKIEEICAEYPRYGYRRIMAQLHRDRIAVNHKRAMRIMREQGLIVRPRRRFIATTNNNHGGPRG